MKKIPSLYLRDWKGDKALVTCAVNPECLWVFDERAVPTVKFDGTACLWHERRLWKRYDVKHGKAQPAVFLPAQPPDPETGHWPGWVPVGDGPEDRWHREAVLVEPLGDGIYREGQTYELVGPKVGGNAERAVCHQLWRHGSAVIMPSPPVYFDALRAWFAERDPIEGIVWHHADGRMAKIKRRDFGLPWPVRTLPSVVG